ncbi:DUF3857 domain-containing protein [Lutibacter sp.]
MKKIYITVLCTLFFISSATSQDYNFNTKTIPENLKKGAHSVILFEELFVEIKSQKLMTYTVKKAVTVLDKKGDENKYVAVGFDKNTKIQNIKTVIYNALGIEIKKVKKKEYKNVSQVDGGTLYADNRMLYYEHVPTSYPYTIFYEYEVATVNTGFIPRWQPIRSYLTSIISSTYSIKSTNNLKVRVKEKNFEGYSIQKNTLENMLNYKLENQEAIKREPNSPFLENFTPNLLVGLNKFHLEGINGEATNWAEFGQWRYNFLNNGNDKINENAKRIVNNLVEGVTNPIEKAKIIYKYVQDKTRYISVQEGIGGWKPISANEVHNLGYGDCKGLTNYTKALLDAVDVESYYTVIWAGDEKKSVEKDFFSMQGNHIILNLPTDTEDIWLECTSQKVPFGYLGSFTDDRDALVITPEGGIIKHTKVYKTQENLQFTKGVYEIDSEGTITAKAIIESKGTQYHDNLLRYDGESSKELKILFKQYLSNINNIKFSKLEVNNNREENKFEENLEFTASDYASFSGNQMLLPINAFNKYSYVPKRIRNRKLPFVISRGFLDIDEVAIKLPDSYLVEYTPENIKLDTEFGLYVLTFTKVNGNTFNYKRTLQINEGKFPKEKYEAYRKFRENIRKYDNSKIILKKL